MTHKYSKYHKEINLLGDVLLLNIAFLAVYFLAFDILSTIFKSHYFELALFFNILWIVSAYILNVHDNIRTLFFERIIRRLLNALGLNLLLIFAFLGVKGEMSVVGPRPHMLKHNEEFSKAVDKFMLRHSIKPGITGLAQAKGYWGETNTLIKLKNRVKLDRFYVENWSLLFDLKIITMTVSSMFKGDENAY